MTDAVFHDALNAAESTRLHAVMLVYADWLEEQGDLRAAGYRWLAKHGVTPMAYGRLYYGFWVRWATNSYKWIPHAVCESLVGGRANPALDNQGNHIFANTRAAACDKFATIFAKATLDSVR